MGASNTKVDSQSEVVVTFSSGQEFKWTDEYHYEGSIEHVRRVISLRGQQGINQLVSSLHEGCCLTFQLGISYTGSGVVSEFTVDGKMSDQRIHKALAKASAVNEYNDHAGEIQCKREVTYENMVESTADQLVRMEKQFSSLPPKVHRILFQTDKSSFETLPVGVALLFALDKFELIAVTQTSAPS